LLLASDGYFYGTTSAGGANNTGTVYKFDPAGNVPAIQMYSFGAAGGTDGQQPYAPLIQGNDGHLYGTTYAGGINGSGAVVKF
jgi:uncharacterized repeat protein (TIGR03803 family)